VDGFEKRSGIQIHLELSSEGRQSPELETMLFRVVQECLINIHRHSGSTKASIRLSETVDHIVLEVEDEGRGLSAEELSRIASGAALGVGLRGMRERIKDFRGELEILSPSGLGTKVRAIIPAEIRRSTTLSGETEPDILDASAIAKRASAN
jgi:signal transduction histidine kinase